MVGVLPELFVGKTIEDGGSSTHSYVNDHRYRAVRARATYSCPVVVVMVAIGIKI